METPNTRNQENDVGPNSKYPLSNKTNINQLCNCSHAISALLVQLQLLLTIMGPNSLDKHYSLMEGSIRNKRYMNEESVIKVFVQRCGHE